MGVMVEVVLSLRHMVVRNKQEPTRNHDSGALCVKGNMVTVVLSLWHMMFRNTQALNKPASHPPHYPTRHHVHPAAEEQQCAAAVQWAAVAAGSQQQFGAAVSGSLSEPQKLQWAAAAAAGHESDTRSQQWEHQQSAASSGQTGSQHGGRRSRQQRQEYR